MFGQLVSLGKLSPKISAAALTNKKSPCSYGARKTSKKHRSLILLRDRCFTIVWYLWIGRLQQRLYWSALQLMVQKLVWTILKTHLPQDIVMVHPPQKILPRVLDYNKFPFFGISLSKGPLLCQMNFSSGSLPVSISKLMRYVLLA